MRNVQADKSAKLIADLEGDDFSCHAGPLSTRLEWQELRRRVLSLDTQEHELYTVEDGWIELHSGERFFYRSPTADMIHLSDIAASLGKTARYAGHTHTFYSVAEHSCLLMRWARRNIVPDRRLLRTILMHDATEAYIPDVPRPLKHMVPLFREFEGSIERVMSPKFDLISPHPAIIREIDSRILRDEREQAMNPSGNDWGTDKLEPLGVKLHLWPPEVAIDNFLGDYAEVAP
jgi:hypothetical protein